MILFVFRIAAQPVSIVFLLQFPDDPHIELTQGFTSLITSNQLNTTDPDTAPSDLVYTVTDEAQMGYLSLLDQVRYAENGYEKLKYNNTRNAMLKLLQ